MKVNVGCGQMLLDGYLNVDLAGYHVDVRSDLFDLTLSNVDEILLSHVLEHLPRREAPQAVKHLAGWLRRGGRLIVEVPNMPAIATGIWNSTVEQYVYGSQDHEGEFHRSGYCRETLEPLMLAAGLEVVSVRTFDSTHPMRPGLPCLEVVGQK